MNANELADNISLDNCHLSYADRLSIALMLRQLQLQIDQLLETQDYLYKMHDADKAEIGALKLHIKILSNDLYHFNEGN